jgi:hypothetical protein
MSRCFTTQLSVVASGILNASRTSSRVSLLPVMAVVKSRMHSRCAFAFADSFCAWSIRCFPTAIRASSNSMDFTSRQAPLLLLSAMPSHWAMARWRCWPTSSSANVCALLPGGAKSVAAAIIAPAPTTLRMETEDALLKLPTDTSNRILLLGTRIISLT